MQFRKNLPAGKAADAEARTGIYDPIKPFNVNIRGAISQTHQSDGPLIVIPHGKRFMMEMDPNFIANHYRQVAADGIGTKALIHYIMRTEHLGAQDAFAMVMDDLIEGGYNPLSFVDHIQMQEENKLRMLSIVNSLVGLATKHKIALVGGETAIINTMKGFEVGIVAEGYVRKGHEIRANAKPGDLIIGIASDHLHSNGYSFIRDNFSGSHRGSLNRRARNSTMGGSTSITERTWLSTMNFMADNLSRFFEGEYDYLHKKAPWGGEGTIGDTLTIPTRIYLQAIKDLLREFTYGLIAPASETIHGMVHITGGGLSKLTELIPESNDVDIKIKREHALKPQAIYSYIQQEFSVPSSDMYKRFNNGIGYAIAVEPSIANAALKLLRTNHYPSEIIGKAEKGSGNVQIESEYDGEIVTYQKTAG
jgi:phosphoribosylformylglycinamidine cyclo-ligase